VKRRIKHSMKKMLDENCSLSCGTKGILKKPLQGGITKYS